MLRPYKLALLAPLLAGNLGCFLVEAYLALEDEAETPAPRAEPPPVKLQPAPKTKWTHMGMAYLRFEVESLPYGAEVRLSLFDGALRLDAIKLPVGTVLECSGLKYEVIDEPKSHQLLVPVDTQLANEKWETFQKERFIELVKVDWKIPFTVTLPGYEPVEEVSPPLPASNLIDGRFEQIAQGKSMWPGEDGPPAGEVPAAVAWVHGSGFAALGTAGTVADVRFVTTVTAIPNNRTKRCTGYVGAPDFTATAHDETIQIIDRFTREALAEKTFQGRPSCPRSVVSGPNYAPSSDSGPSSKAMKKWVRSKMSKLARDASTPPS
ncbi:MAG: hypothetical protein AAF799_47255 [Myxococcota bacterium]